MLVIEVLLNRDVGALFGAAVGCSGGVHLQALTRNTFCVLGVVSKSRKTIHSRRQDR